MMKKLLFLNRALFTQGEHENGHEIHPHKDNNEMFFENTYNVTNLFTIGLDYENQIEEI